MSTPQTVTGLTATAGRAGRAARMRAPLLLAAAVLGTSLLLHLRDPHRSGSYLYCPWLLLTGDYCPGCGGLRAVNDLTHGRVLEAASSNLLLVGSLPLLVGLWLRWARDRWRGVQRAGRPVRALVQVAVLLAVVAAFWVVRNLPAGAWLAP